MTRRDWLGVLGSAALLNLAYPPFTLVAPAFVCLVSVIVPFLEPAPIRRHMARGFWFGVLWSALLLHWIGLAVWRFKPSATAGFLVVVLAYGFYTSLTFGLVAWIHDRAHAPLIVVFPAAWTALEWLASHHGYTSPWLGLSYALTPTPALIQLADTIGGRGLTFLLAAANTCLALAWSYRRVPRRALALAGSVAVALAVVFAYGAFRLTTLRLRPAGVVTVVQPNLGAKEKWDPARQDALVRATLLLSRDSARAHTPDLVVWPELALPAPLVQRPAWASAVSWQAADLRVPILVGGIDVVPQPTGSARTYNAAFLFGGGPQGSAHPYRKERLVLVFERLNGTSAWHENEPLVTPVGQAGVLICHEDTFEQLARERRRQGADVLVNLANDAWFLGTAAPAQHAAHVVLRAVETRAGVVRAGNTGPSGFVDPLGRRHSWTPEATRTAVTDTLWTSDVVPIYARLGDWVGVGCLLTLLASAAVATAAARNSTARRGAGRENGGSCLGRSLGRSDWQRMPRNVKE
jgi:apolipoprotein N-acyltransferase